MPIYEYTCKSCHGKFEHLARTMSEHQKPKCPKCGSNQTARALSLFAVGSEQSKGTGDFSGGPGMCGRCGGPGPCAGGFGDGD